MQLYFVMYSSCASHSRAILHGDDAFYSFSHGVEAKCWQNKKAWKISEECSNMTIDEFEHYILANNLQPFFGAK